MSPSAIDTHAAFVPDRGFLRADIVRWGLSAIVVLTVHAGAVALALRQSDDEGEVNGNQYMTVDLDVETAAPILGATEQNQGLMQTQSEEISQASVAQEEIKETKPVEKAPEETPQVAVAPNAEVTLPEERKAVPKPDEETEKKEDATDRKPQQASEARAESSVNSAPLAAAKLSQQAALSRGIETDDRAAFMTWRTLLGAHVQRFKRYPAEALARGQAGVATVTFTVDRKGKLVASNVRGTSGVPLLDAEALTLLARAEPLPPAPDNVAGSSFSFTVPIRFSLPK